MNVYASILAKSSRSERCQQFELKIAHAFLLEIVRLKVAVCPISNVGQAVFANDLILHNDVLHCTGNVFSQVDRVALWARTRIAVNVFSFVIRYIFGLNLPLGS